MNESIKNSKDDDIGMITHPGYILIGGGSAFSAGFNFDYKDPRFDGCRMGQLLPSLWGIDQLKKEIQRIEDNSTVFDRIGAGKHEDPYSLGEDLAASILQAKPYDYGSYDMQEFIEGVTAGLKKYNRDWE